MRRFIVKRKNYIQISIIVGLFLFMNLFPFSAISESLDDTGSSHSNLVIDFYPEDPYDASLLNTDTTLTLEVRNRGSKVENYKLNVFNSSENLFMNARDGFSFPLRDEIRPHENKYYSFALVPKNTSNNYQNIRAVLNSNDKTIRENFSLNIERPETDFEGLDRILRKEEIDPTSRRYLIPRYRRYWHPELDSSGDASMSYVWLLVSENHNYLIDAESGEVIKEDFKLPWGVSSNFRTEARVWNGYRFENRSIPTVDVGGDTTFHRERGEIYLAERNGKMVWVSRRIFYWTLEKTESPEMDESPDTERIELWYSLEDGESILTMSDYHHHAFTYKPVEEYTIQEYYHTPIPSNLPLQWTTFVLVDYREVYPNSETPYDHVGFSKDTHPIGRVISEKGDLIVKNSIAFLAAIIILAGPRIWDRLRNGQ